ncbi:hypothetical protein VAB18032_22300 [Micromonospora maris AB-18-032]|nr:hypothetical protein VAB18032_22300 [Micromonospora maris AB-18-032]
MEVPDVVVRYASSSRCRSAAPMRASGAGSVIDQWFAATSTRVT